ncbi:hypothetical protein WAE61_14800 [Comamonadaceae bacterium PP-2]
MKFKSLSRWTLTPELGGLLFFAQRMDELLWDFTLDTHKPMSLNAPYLCIEALSVISNIEDELIEAANLEPIMEELIWAIQNDPIAKSLLDLPVERYVLLGDQIKISERRNKLNALSNTLSPTRYLNRCLDELSKHVKESKKKKIDATARLLATTLINMGVSKKHLLQTTNHFFFGAHEAQITSPNQIDDFLASIYPYLHDCNAYFIVSQLITSVKESLNSFQITILDKLPDDVALADTAIFTPREDERIVRVGPIEAFDAYTAQEMATVRLDRLSDFFTLFYHQQKITWRDTAVVTQCCQTAPFVTELTHGAMVKPYDMRPEKASKELNRLLQNLTIRGPSRSRFNRVADLHGTCVSTDIIDNQMVTLWTALETLIPSKTGSSKIVNILDCMLPFLMHAYIRRLVQRFTHDLITWNKWATKKILNKVPDISGSDTIHRALALLCVPTNQNLRDELYTDLRDFHLLRFRAFQLSEILTSPKSLQDTLKTHESKIRWQIRRIYRTRNLLVHSGQRPSYIQTLVENAHDYLDLLLFETMKLSCGEYQAYTLEQVFELAKFRHTKFCMDLDASETFTAENCSFLIRDHDSLEHFQLVPWSPAEKSEV